MPRTLTAAQVASLARKHQAEAARHVRALASEGHHRKADKHPDAKSARRAMERMRRALDKSGHAAVANTLHALWLADIRVSYAATHGMSTAPGQRDRAEAAARLFALLG